MKETTKEFFEYKVAPGLFALGMIVLVAGLISACSISTQGGKSVDYVYGYDTGPVWNHLYLTNDHTTTYCFDKTNAATWTPIFDQSLKENKKVEIDYAKYVVKGALCQGQPQGSKGSSETVIVTNVVLQ